MHKLSKICSSTFFNVDENFSCKVVFSTPQAFNWECSICTSSCNSSCRSPDCKSLNFESSHCESSCELSMVCITIALPVFSVKTCPDRYSLYGFVKLITELLICSPFFNRTISPLSTYFHGIL